MAISGCAELQKKTTQQEKESTTMVTDTVNTESGNYYETYEGILPCADCGGIRTTQKINSDTIYQLWSEYLGKKDGIFGENGIYNIMNEIIIGLATPSSGEKTFGAVALSDSLRMLNSDELAKHYILKKQ